MASPTYETTTWFSRGSEVGSVEVAQAWPEDVPRGRRPGADGDREPLLLVVHADAVVEVGAHRAPVEQGSDVGVLTPHDHEGRDRVGRAGLVVERVVGAV